MLKEFQNGFTEEERTIMADIGETIHLAARCGLGQTSLNFVNSILDKYEDEFVERGLKYVKR